MRNGKTTFAANARKVGGSLPGLLLSPSLPERPEALPEPPALPLPLSRIPPSLKGGEARGPSLPSLALPPVLRVPPPLPGPSLALRPAPCRP